MRSHLREILREAKKLGFRFDGYDGRGHPRLVHDTGRRLSVAATPSDVAGSRNAVADMRRIQREEGDKVSTTTVAQEVWKPVIGLPAYELSNAGNFRKRLTGKRIRPTGHGAGLTVRLTDDKGRSHEKNVRRMVQSHFGCNPLMVVESTLTQTIGERMKVRELANPISHQPKVEKEEAMTIQAETLGLPVEHVGQYWDNGLPRHTVEVPSIEVPQVDSKEPEHRADSNGMRWAMLAHEGVAKGYEINDQGEILSPSGSVLKNWVTSGNTWVSLRREGPSSKPYLQTRLDLLMVENFHGPQPGPDYGPEHVNGDLGDNSVTNLRWSAGFAIPVGAHRGKHRFQGHVMTDEQIEQFKTDRLERKRARDRKRYYANKAKRDAKKVEWVEETVGQGRHQHPATLHVDAPAIDEASAPRPDAFPGHEGTNEVIVSTVTSYCYRGIEVIVDHNGSFQAPEMTLENAADLAKILTKISERV